MGRALAVVAREQASALLRFVLVAVAVVMCVGTGNALAGTPGPRTPVWVTDSAHVLTPADRRHLSRMLSEYHRQTHHQIAILTIRTLGDETIQAYSLRSANQMGLGYKGLNNGILVTLAVKEGLARIELGIGMSRYISDADSKKILETQMLPAFSKRDFAGGFERGTRKLMAMGRAFVVKPQDLPADAGSAAH